MHRSSSLMHRSRCSQFSQQQQRLAFRTQRAHRCVAAAACSTKHESALPLGQIVSSLAATAILLSSAAPSAHAEAIYAAGPSQYAFPAAERYAEQQEARYDEYLQTKELKELLTLLDKSSYKQSDLEAARLKVGFRREMDGRVSLKGQDGHWYWVKNDMQAPGFILVCDQQDGRVLFLPPDESGRLMQIDLSDDVVVGQLFGSGAWQDVMEPLQAEDYDGNIVPLIMSERDFRNTASLLEDAVEQEAASM